MKLTNREKILLLILVSLTAVIGLYSLAVKPRLNEIAAVQQKLNETRISYQATKLLLSPDSKLNKDFKSANLKASAATQNLFPSIIQEKLILILNDMLSQCGIPAGSMSFTETAPGQVETIKDTSKSTDTPLKQLAGEYNGQAPDKTQTASKSAASASQGNTAQNVQQTQANLGTVDRMSLTLNLRTDYDKLQKFIELVENYDKKIVVKNLNIGRNNDITLSAVITLDFYAVPRLSAQDDNYLIWELSGTYGSSNPFTAFSGYSPAASQDAQQLPVQPAADFIINVQPYTADMPSVAIGKAKDTTAKSYLTYDSQDMVDAEFVVTKSGNKYYCKYKTSNGSMPSDYNSPGLEFEPKGSTIELNIVSNPRNSANDVNGINLTIINNTDLTLNTNIKNDDQLRNRVNISSKSGNITINRQ